MSCDYDFRCLDCDCRCGLEDFNHAGDELAMVLRGRDALAAAGAFVESLSNDAWHFTDPSEGPLLRVGRFFAAHVGHRVVAMDEYGAQFGACSVRVNCDCGHGWRCALPPGHEGEHKRQR